MDSIIPLIGAGTAVFLAALAWESFGRRPAATTAVSPLPAGVTFAAKPILTDREVQLYNMLRLAVEDRYLLFTQIPLWCLLDLKLPPGTPRNDLLRELALTRATFVLVHPGNRLVEKVVQVERESHEEQPEGARDAIFRSALQAAGVQLVRLREGDAYTVPGLVTALDLADPE
ncbi:MAG: DUF2726 domain-containing protein [Nitrospiraceae bacterium]|nr:DUF2726 domain-containing protein [Nitrospiraceae bacterium]